MSKETREMLGKKFQDVVTGFQGVCIGVADYYTGCKQALLVPRMNDDGTRRDGEWFDADRLELVDETALLLPGHRQSDLSQKPVGGDREAPKR